MEVCLADLNRIMTGVVAVWLPAVPSTSILGFPCSELTLVGV